MVNDNIKKNKRINRIFLLISIYLVLIVNYYFVIAVDFSYGGYNTNYFSFLKMFFTFVYSFIVISLSMIIKRDFYKLIYSILLIMYFYGQSIYYIFNDSPFILVILASIPLIAVIIADRLDSNRVIKRSTINLKDKNTRIFMIILAALAIIPYFRYIGTVNLKNLLLIDIYNTRELMRAYDRGILGYLFSPLSRTIFPFLFIYGITKKRKIITSLSIIGIILLFLLNGAVKSVFFGMVAAVIFLKGNYLQKERHFLRLFQVVNVFALFSYLVLNNNLINDYIRRIVLVPARLYDIYYSYFNENFTHFSHSKTYSLLSNTSNDISVSRFIGEYVIGREGLNANTGIFVEGYISFGLIGVILFSLFFLYILIYVRKINFSKEYFGIFFVYIYIINTSFIETLMITHGLLFFLVFIYFFFPKEDNKIQNFLD